MKRGVKKYDVIIVGAGVSGLYLAKLLNNSKLKVLLIENRSTIKKLRNHRYGTFKETIKKFKLEKYVIKKYKKLGFLYGSKEKSLFSYKSNQFQIVDMNSFSKNLKLKCDVKTNFRIKNIQRKNKIIEVTGQDEKYLTNIIVDCSGESKIVSKYIGETRKKSLDFYSLSLELSDCNIELTNELQFIADLKYLNTAFWFYPYSKKECQIGLTEWFYTYPSEKKENRKIFAYMKKEEPYRTWFKNAKVKEKLFKIGPAATLNKKIVDDNFISCGDAAGAGTPAIGEGFRISLEMASSAYKTIIDSYKKKDFSYNSLKQHKERFEKNFNKYYIWSKIIRRCILSYFTEKEYGIFIKNLKKLSEKDFLEVLKSRITLRIFLKGIDIRLVSLTIMNMIKYHIGGNKYLNKQLIK